MPKIPKKWKPTDKDIQQIEALAGYGLPKETIADFFGVSVSLFDMAMKKNPAINRAMVNGVAKAKARVTQTAYEMAISKKFPAMTMFYLKTRLRWTERTVIEHQTPQNNEQAQSQMTQAVQDFKMLLEDFKRLPASQQPEPIRGLLTETEPQIEALKAEIIS